MSAATIKFKYAGAPVALASCEGCPARVTLKNEKLSTDLKPCVSTLGTFIHMKRIITFTFGWDIRGKSGYLTLLDEDGGRHAFRDLNSRELQMLAGNLERYTAFIDQNHWILWGTSQSETHD